MDEQGHRGIRITRRTVLDAGTVTAALLLGGFPKIALAAPSDAEVALNSVDIELKSMASFSV